MKKLIFLLPFLVATLFAHPSTPYVWLVTSELSIINEDGSETKFSLSDYLQGEYYTATIKESCPNSGTGYICSTNVEYNYTQYKHLASEYIHIYVHYPLTTPSTDAVFIWERNQYEREENLNDRLIKGYGTSEYEKNVYSVGDGSTIIEYIVPDKSPYHKRITIASCPNNQSQTQIQCTYTATDIIGYLNYSN